MRPSVPAGTPAWSVGLLAATTASEVLHLLLTEVVPAYGDWAVLDLQMDEQTVVPVAVAGQAGVPEWAVAALVAHRSADARGLPGIGAVLRHGRAYQGQGPAETFGIAWDRPDAAASVVCVPLAVGARVLGTCTVGRGDMTAPLPDDVVAVLSQLGEWGGHALARTQRLERAVDPGVLGASHDAVTLVEELSHEIRTALTGIAGYAELLELGIRGALSDRQREDVGRIRAGANAIRDRIASYVADVAGPNDARDVQPLRDVVRGFDALATDVVTRHGLRWEGRWGSADVTSTGVEARVGRVLRALLGHAVDAAPAGSVVQVAHEDPDARWLVLRHGHRRLPEANVVLARIPALPPDGTGLGTTVDSWTPGPFPLWALLPTIRRWQGAVCYVFSPATDEVAWHLRLPPLEASRGA